MGFLSTNPLDVGKIYPKLSYTIGHFNPRQDEIFGWNEKYEHYNKEDFERMEGFWRSTETSCSKNLSCM